MGVFQACVIIMSELELEQCGITKFLVKLGKTGTKIWEVLVQVYRDNALKKTAVYKWINRFSEGRENVIEDQRSVRQSTSRTVENIQKV